MPCVTTVYLYYHVLVSLDKNSTQTWRNRVRSDQEASSLRSSSHRSEGAMKLPREKSSHKYYPDTKPTNHNNDWSGNCGTLIFNLWSSQQLSKWTKGTLIRRQFMPGTTNLGNC